MLRSKNEFLPAQWKPWGWRKADVTRDTGQEDQESLGNEVREDRVHQMTWRLASMSGMTGEFPN